MQDFVHQQYIGVGGGLRTRAGGFVQQVLQRFYMRIL